MRKYLIALGACLIAWPAWASVPQVSQTVGGQTAINIAGSLTRPADTTTYTANTAVCQSKSTTCVPIQIDLGRIPGGTGTAGRVMLVKSGSATTDAAFVIYFYSASPTVTNIKDNSAYTGPFGADFPNYLGSATCSTPNTGSDSYVWYECTPSDQFINSLPFQAASGSNAIYAMIEATNTYTPASAEKFTIYMDGYQD